MKVSLFNGSAKENGCVYTALSEIAAVLNQEGIETEILQMGSSPVYDCTGCDFCHNAGDGYCIFEEDMVNEWLDKVKTADGFVFGSPVYYAHPTGQFQAVLCRRRILYVQTGRGDRNGAQGGNDGLARCTQQIFYRRVYACHFLYLLEHGAWKYTRTGKAGRRRTADYAQPRQKYGVAAQKHRSGQKGGAEGTDPRNGRMDKLYPLR